MSVRRDNYSWEEKQERSDCHYVIPLYQTSLHYRHNKDVIGISKKYLELIFKVIHNLLVRTQPSLCYGPVLHDSKTKSKFNSIFWLLKEVWWDGDEVGSDLTSSCVHVPVIRSLTTQSWPPHCLVTTAAQLLLVVGVVLVVVTLPCSQVEHLQLQLLRPTTQY